MFFSLSLFLLLHFRFGRICEEHVRLLHRYTHGSVVCCLPPHYLYLAFLPMLSLPKSSPTAVPPLDPPTQTQCVILPSLCSCVLVVQHPPMSENMQCFILCSCVSLLRIIISSFIHDPTKDMNSSFFMAAYYSTVYMCHIFPVQSIIDGHLGWFQVFAIVNSGAMNIHVHGSFNRTICNPLGIYPVMGLLG